jgi:membrane protease YdiL (CAAX protease family)
MQPTEISTLQRLIGLGTIEMYDMLTKKEVWGAWATGGFTLLIGIVVTVAQIIGMVGYLAVLHVLDPSLKMRDAIHSLGVNGLFLSISTVISFTISIGLVPLFCRLRRGLRLRDYLALKGVKTRTLLICIGITLAAGALTDGISSLMGHPIVPEFMISAYRSAGSLPLLFIVICLLAPISEELIFRGFLYKGLSCSRLGATGAIILTSLSWAALHLQYDVYEIVSIFVFGLILGIARTRTKSVVPSILMHVAINVMATVEAMIAVASG